jgi:hypothetical protein
MVALTGTSSAGRLAVLTVDLTSGPRVAPRFEFAQILARAPVLAVTASWGRRPRPRLACAFILSGPEWVASPIA